VGVQVRREDRPEGGCLARVTIDNAGKLNSLNRGLMSEIVDTIGGLAPDPRLRLVVLSGAGERAFVGGADIVKNAVLSSDCGFLV
jgi:enoyl-CoA hydratase/carnithine racemase